MPVAVTPSLTRTAPASLSASRSYGTWAAAPAGAGRVTPAAAPAVAAPTMTFEAGVFERTNPYAVELKETANYIARNGRGIMASDESNSTTGKRLAMVDLENTEVNRRRWRELLYTAPDLGKYISGCIMYVWGPPLRFFGGGRGGGRRRAHTCACLLLGAAAGVDEWCLSATLCLLAWMRRGECLWATALTPAFPFLSTPPALASACLASPRTCPGYGRQV